MSSAARSSIRPQLSTEPWLASDGGASTGALLDPNLHGASVLPVAEELAGSAVPFVLLTGYSRRESDPPLLREARRASKPFSLSSLSAAIAETLLR